MNIINIITRIILELLFAILLPQLGQKGIIECQSCNGKFFVNVDGAVDTTAVANAIDKNTKSKVKESYNAFLIVGLVAAVTVTVVVVISISVASERRREKKHRKKGSGDDVFDWAEKYNKD